MPITTARDPERLRARLTDWLGARLDADDLRVSVPTMPADTGFSHQTLLVDAAWSSGARGLVVKMLAAEHHVFLDPDPAAEYRVLEALGDTGVLAPGVVGFEPDPDVLGAPFYVIERIDGRIPPDKPPYTIEGWLLEAAPEEQGRAWWSGIEAMAAVHRVDAAALKVAPVARGTGHDLGDVTRYAAWVLDGRAQPDLEATLDVLSAAPPSVEHGPGLCWGDSRLANLIYRGFDVAGVLDWEMATIGDPQADLAWWICFDRLFSEGLSMPRLPGFPSYDDTVARWQELTGRRASDLAGWTLFAAARFALILLRLATLEEGRGEYPLGPDYLADNFAIAFARRLAEERG